MVMHTHPLAIVVAFPLVYSRSRLLSSFRDRSRRRASFRGTCEIRKDRLLTRAARKGPQRAATHLPADFRYTGLSCPTVNAVEFQGVSKSYAIYESPGDRLKELLSLNRLNCHRDFQALQDLTFEVKRGETFCIVGENGSGKSTMLQMVAGILRPTRSEE